MTSTILSVLLLIYGFHLWIIEYEIFLAEFKVSVEKREDLSSIYNNNLCLDDLLYTL